MWVWSCWKQLKDHHSWEICSLLAALTVLRNICPASLSILLVPLHYLEQREHLSLFFLPQIGNAVTFFLVICTDKVVIPSVFHDARIAFGDVQIVKWRTQNCLAISSISVKCCLWLTSPLKVLSWTAQKNLSSVTHWYIKKKALSSAM